MRRLGSSESPAGEPFAETTITDQSPGGGHGHCDPTLHIRHFLNSVVIGLNLFLLAVNSLFSPTFLPPGLVVLLAPAFQGSGVITFPSLPFFSHFSQTMIDQ